MTGENYKIYKDDKTILEISAIQNLLNNYEILQGGIKVYRNTNNYSGLIVTYGSTKYIINDKNAAEIKLEEIRLSICKGCKDKNMKCKKTCKLKKKMM